MRKREKVCILGFAPSWVDAPFENEEYEVWALNEMYKVANQHPKFRAEKWFEIHDLTTPSKSGQEHQEFLKNCPCQLYVQKKYDWLPNATVFPLDEIIKFFEEKGIQGARYFTNSISYFIAYAIYLGYKEIVIYGVDMATSGEYQAQRPSCEYWIALAEGMGIKAYVPPNSDLLKCTQLYAVESSNKNRVWIKTQVKELSKRQQAYAQQEEQAQKAAHQAQIAQAEIRGAKSAYNEILIRLQ